MMSKKNYILIKFKSEKDWLRARSLGGTYASALLGMNPWLTANEVYDHIKFNEKNESISNEAIERGKALEPLIRKEFAVLNKDKYKVIAPPKNNWIFKLKQEERITASLDGELIDLATKEKGVLEIKTKEFYSEKAMNEWINGTLPQQYYVQVLHYLLVTGYKFVIVNAKLILRDVETNELKRVVNDLKMIRREDKEKEIEFLLKKELEFLGNLDKGIRPKIFIKIPEDY